MDIQEQLKKIEVLRNAYETILEVEDANSIKAVHAFHLWHTSAIAFFADVLGVEDQLLKKMSHQEGLGENGYVLNSVYHSILGLYTMLRVKVEKLRDRQDTTDMAEIEECKKNKKIFISHSSKDKKFAEALILLLNSLNINEGNVFCSSVPGYWIKKGNFFEVIKEQFEHNDLYVIFIQSPRFYSSPVSLNEMGAAWALHREYYSFLTKDMDYEQMSAVVNNHDIACKVNNEDAKERLNDWMIDISRYFGKRPPKDWSLWESHRDVFLKTVRRLSYKKVKQNPKSTKQLETNPTLSKKDEILLKKWVDSGDNKMFQMWDEGGSAVFGLGARNQYEIESGRKIAEWRGFLKRLSELELIEQTGYDKAGKHPEYQLTEKAYAYFEK